MSPNEKKKNDKDDQLKFENKLNKLKQELQQNLNPNQKDESREMPSELEDNLIKYIEQFEQSLKDAPRSTIFKLLGEPVFANECDIPDTEIRMRLNQAMEMLSGNNICLETIFEVDDRILYRFITEELIYEEIDYFQVDGLVTHFVYEDFYPYHEYDIVKNCEDFIDSFLDTESDFFKTFLLCESEYTQKLVAFRSSFDYFELKSFIIENLNCAETLALVEFSADIYGKFDDNLDEMRFRGKGNLAMIYENDSWCVYWAKIPGIEF